MKRFTAVAVLALVTQAWCQQQTKPAPAQPETQKAAQADPADVRSLDAIVHALYDVISGPAGQPRNWDRFRSLFHPQARMIPVGKRPVDAKTGARVLTADDYIQSVGPYFEKNSFFEREVADKREQFAHIAHVFSTYESRHAKDEKPFQRGINSFQLYNDGARWWIMNVMWDAETPENPIPEKYLK